MAKKTHRKHRLIALGQKGNIVISPRSRLAPRSRGMHLNPGLKLGPIVSDVKETVLDTGMVLIGFAGVKLIPKYVVPASWQTGYMKYVVEGATGLALYIVAGKILKKPRVAKMILMGSILSIAVDLLQNVLPLNGGTVGTWISPSDIAAGRTRVGVGAGAGQPTY